MAKTSRHGTGLSADLSADLSAAVSDALRAPSVHNTQPWRWRIGADRVELHADWTRHLPWTDPDRRDLMISCGAALHHLRVALAARDLAIRVRRMPDPDRLGHLATITVTPGDADPAMAALYPVIEQRRTDRRRMSHRPVPRHLLRECAQQAEHQGAELIAATAPAVRERLEAALARGAREQQVAPGYAAELALWTARYPGGRDGVPAENVPAAPTDLLEPSPLRRFPRARLSQPHQSLNKAAIRGGAELLVLVTAEDEPLDWLRAGEATSAVLLTATRAGLATTPLSQAIETSVSRRELRHSVLRVSAYPQLVVRIGWPASRAAELPPTPRRDLGSVLLTH
ncbi:NAD(P)H nitroreductase [Pseudonocardia eucalypti]|uniref:NAD(P)H nitroreductase n=1 Tax=Pseudonocardia eucalypti TaxID=648755 RepID=A0ABP9QI74_9PSEU|nr:nitroreductase [Pseudonocardia eucalypti]